MAPMAEEDSELPALRRVRLKNFMSFAAADVELAPVSVLVGPNGAGKSNFLKAFGFLGDSARLDLGPAIDAAGGFSAIHCRAAKLGARVQISIEALVSEFATEKALDVYTLTFWEAAIRDKAGKEIGMNMLVRSEEFKFKRTPRQGRRITITGNDVTLRDKEGNRAGVETKGVPLNPQSLGLATLPKLEDDSGGAAIRSLAELFTTFRVFDIHVSKARQTAVVTSNLANDASNLAGFLTSLCQDADVLERINEDARQLIAGFDRLVFERVGGDRADRCAVGFIERGLRGPTWLADASYGTVHALALLALLYDPNPPRLTCIEEFDHGLHPYAFDILVDRMREASRRTQFLVTTHSPAFVNRLRPEELVVVERDQHTGATIMPAVDSSEIRAIEEAAGGFGLGELWFSGTLGGVPEA